MSSYEENVTPMEPLNNKTYTFYFEINKNNYKNICIPLPFIKSFNGYKLDNLWNNNKECYDCNINENEFNYPITNSKQEITVSDQGGLPIPPNTFIILDELKGSDTVNFQCASSSKIEGCTPYSSAKVCIGDSKEIEITPIPPKADYLDTSSYCKDPDQNIYIGATSKLISTTPNSSKQECETICSNDKNCEMYLMDSTDCKIYKDVSNVKMYCNDHPKHAFYGNVKTRNSLKEDNVVKMDEITIPKINCAANYGSTTPCCGQEGPTMEATFKNVYTLGKLGIGPWKGAPGFKNQKAKWIWFTKNANISAPGSANASFKYTWNNSSSSNISAKINIIVDNEASIIVNGKNIGEQKGGWGGSGGLFNVILPPGKNDFIFDATNEGTIPNPAGLIVSVLDENDKILFSTGDSGWKYSTAKDVVKAQYICPYSKPVCKDYNYGKNWGYCTPSSKAVYLDTSSHCKDPYQNIYVSANSKLISTTPNSSKEKCEVICSNNKNCEMYLMDSTDCKIYKDVSNVKMYCDYAPKHAFYGNVKIQNFLNKKNVVKTDEITIPKIKCAANYGSSTPCCGQEGKTVKTQYICPSSKPVCKDYNAGKNWGSCVIKDNLKDSFINDKNKLSIPVSCSGKSCLSFFPPDLAAIEKKNIKSNESMKINILENLKPCSGSSFDSSQGFPACTDNNGIPVQLCVSGNPKFNYTVYTPNSYRKLPTFNSNRVYEKPVFFKSGFYNNSNFLATLSLLQSSIQKGNNLPEGTYAIYEVSYTLEMNSNLEFQLMDFLYLQNKLSGTFTDWFKKTKIYDASLENIKNIILDFCNVSKNSALCKQKINLPNLENQIENFEFPKNKNMMNYIILFICILLIFFIYYRKLYVS